MKGILFALALAGLLILLGSLDARAQVYAPYPYASYGDSSQYQPYPYAQQYDPYYDLHVMHYQLYLQPYGYPVYQPFITGVAPLWFQPIVPVPQVIIRARPPAMRRH